MGRTRPLTAPSCMLSLESVEGFFLMGRPSDAALFAAEVFGDALALPAPLPPATYIVVVLLMVRFELLG